jgi:hypothetical protein
VRIRIEPSNILCHEFEELVEVVILDERLDDRLVDVWTDIQPVSVLFQKILS